MTTDDNCHDHIADWELATGQARTFHSAAEAIAWLQEPEEGETT